MHLPSDVAQRSWWPKCTELEHADGAYLPVPGLGYTALTDDGADDDAEELLSLGVYQDACPGLGPTALSAAFWADD